MKRSVAAIAGLFFALNLLGVASAAPITLDSLDWDVQFIVDNSQDDPFGLPQSPLPRNNRGLALSPDGDFLYAGYNDKYIRKIDLSEPDVIDAIVAQLDDTDGLRGKAIAVDDRGRVYLAEGSSIEIYDPDLTTKLGDITGLTKTEGVAVVRDGGDLVLYSTDRTDGTLTKRILTEAAGAGATAITGDAIDATFGVAGVVALGSNLRGVEVAGDGTIWVAGRGTDLIYRVSTDGLTVDTASVSNPFDIAFDGDTVLVTRDLDRLISRFLNDAGISSAGSDLVVPWVDLKLDPDGQSSVGALTGIAILPGVGFFVANETGQTADEKSTYGRIDLNSGFIGPNFFTDKFGDDNDPILFASSASAIVPEPSTFALLGSGLALLYLGSRRRKRKTRV